MTGLKYHKSYIILLVEQLFKIISAIKMMYPPYLEWKRLKSNPFQQQS